MTFPFLFITLHFSQIGLTDGLTFIANPPHITFVVDINFSYIYLI